MTEKLEKILYVEDDADIAEVAVMTLQDLGGFEVQHCGSGREALNALPECSPQLVLMDVMMPGMDGPETFRNIQNTPEGKDLPVIFMTAKAQKHEQAQYMEMGALGVVVKPFDPMTLCQKITTLWDRRDG